MGCKNFIAPAAEAATAFFAPELAPILDPIEGAVIGAATGGTRGAITGGLEGLVGGQLSGTGEFAIGSTAATGAPDIFGIATGGRSLGSQILDGIGSAFDFGGGPSGGASAAGDTTNLAGATVNPQGATIAPPVDTTIAAPTSGGGAISAGNVGAFDANAVASQFSQGLTQGTDLTGINAASPSLSTLSGASADSAIGSAGADAIGSTGGLKSWLPSKSDVVGGALKAAPLAYSAMKGPASLPSEAKTLGAQGAATAPLLALENQNANEGLTGKLTSSQEAGVLQYIQQAETQLLQQISSSGSSDPTHDSRYIQGMADIQQKALAMQQQYIQQAIQNATSAGGAASSNIAAVAQDQIAQDKEYQDALAAAFGALGMSMGGGGQPHA